VELSAVGVELVAVIDEPLLLTIPEAARKLGCGRTLLYRLIARGELAEVHLGAAARIPSVALERLVERKLELAVERQAVLAAEAAGAARPGRRVATR
jgi:excisionase family DNA binding protein